MLTWTQRTGSLMMACLLGACAVATTPQAAIERETSPVGSDLGHESFRAIVAFEMAEIGETLIVDPVPIVDLDERVELSAAELQKRADTLEELGVRTGDAVPLRAACASLMSLPQDRGRDGCPASPEIVLVLVGRLEENDSSWRQQGMLVEYHPRGHTIYFMVYIIEVDKNHELEIERSIVSWSH